MAEQYYNPFYRSRTFVDRVNIFSNVNKVDVDVLEALIKSLNFENCIHPYEVIKLSQVLQQQISRFPIFKGCKILITSPGENIIDPSTKIHEFESINISSRGKVPIDLNLVLTQKERSRTLRAGVTSGSRGTGFNLGGSYDNFRGKLESLQFQLFSGLDKYFIDIDYEKPIFGNDFIDKYKIAVVGSKDDFSENSSFKKDCFGLRASLISKYFHSLNYNVSVRNISLNDNINSKIMLHGGVSCKSSLSHSWKSDTRDDVKLPSRGSLINIEHEFAGLGGDTHFLKQNFHIQKHASFSNWGLSNFLNLGFLYPFGKKSSVCDRYFIGGPFPLRGFNKRSIGISNNGDNLGGELYFANGAHINIPLYTNSLQFQIFTNCGSSTLLKRNIFESFSYLVNSARISTGIGLVWASPIGRIEFNLCKILSSQETDKTKSFWDFGVSLSFNE